MTFGDEEGGTVQVQGLARLQPDPARAARVRSLCRNRLERGRRRTARAAEAAELVGRVLAPVVVGGLCVFYVVVLIATTLRLQRLMQ